MAQPRAGKGLSMWASGARRRTGYGSSARKGTRDVAALARQLFSGRPPAAHSPGPRARASSRRPQVLRAAVVGGLRLDPCTRGLRIGQLSGGRGKTEHSPADVCTVRPLCAGFAGLWTAMIINDPVHHQDFSRPTTIAGVSGAPEIMVGGPVGAPKSHHGGRCRQPATRTRRQTPPSP